MKISYLTLFPEFYDSFREHSIVKRAIEKELVELNVIDLKKDVKKGRVDDKIVSGGKGNLLRYDVVSDTLNKYKEKFMKILMTPRGKLFNQEIARQLAKEENLIFVCPHFEGIDSRIEDECDYLLSIGDYILTGGELASEVISDSLIRLIDGVINTNSLDEETFNNDLLEYNQYALPRVYNNKEIPEIYFTGNHEAIKDYKLKESLILTKENRPDLYSKHELSKKEKDVLNKCNQDWIDKIVNKSKK